MRIFRSLTTNSTVWLFRSFIHWAAQRATPRSGLKTFVDRYWSDRRGQPHPRLARGYLVVCSAVGVRSRRWSDKNHGCGRTPCYAALEPPAIDLQSCFCNTQQVQVSCFCSLHHCCPRSRHRAFTGQTAPDSMRWFDIIYERVWLHTAPQSSGFAALSSARLRKLCAV